ncbi:C-type lectin domain family 2 member D isoform X1 [Crocuta crocuta]
MHDRDCVEKGSVPVELLGKPRSWSVYSVYENQGGSLLSKKYFTDIKKILAVSLIIIISIILLCMLFIFISVRGRRSHETPSECFEPACPEDWIGFQRKCFYFSDDIKNWTFSQRFCKSHDADLAQVETLQELDFLMRYKGLFDHWIGLSREQGQPWKWVNGTEFTSCFPIRGGGECAYLNDKGASSARHYTERKWICSKSDRYANVRSQTAA